MTFAAQGVIAIEHPALAGHFPGNPIVPGVLIIEEVLNAVEEWRGELRLTRIASAKFASPLYPGQVFSIRLEDKGEGRIDFECSHDIGVVAAGRLVVESDHSI